MKLITPSNVLIEHLSNVTRVIGSKPPLVAMENVLFEVENDTLHLTATDGELRVKSSMPLEEKIGTNMAFCLRGKTTLEALREVSNQNITLDIDEASGETKLYYSNGNYSFMIENADTFPEATPLGEEQLSLQMPVGTFLEGIDNSNYAASQDDIRPLMMGMHIDIRPEHISFVATDGYVMGLYRNENLAGQATEAEGITLHRKQVQLLKALLSQESADEPLLLQLHNNFVAFSTPTLEVQCRLIEGKYPNYESVIPEGNNKILEVDRLQLMGACKRVSLFGSAAMNVITMEISSNSIRILARDMDYSTSAEEVIPCSFSDPDGLSMAFRPEHFISVLGGSSCETMTIKMGDRSRAALVTPSVTPEGVTIMAAIMPMIF